MAEKNSLWKNIRNKAKQNRESGATPKEPTEAMLKQEKEINAEYAKGGPVGDDENGIPYRPLSMPMEGYEWENRPENHVQESVKKTTSNKLKSKEQSKSSKNWKDDLYLTEQQLQEQMFRKKGTPYNLPKTSEHLQAIGENWFDPNRVNSVGENLIEAVDPSGISSWDDASTSYSSKNPTSFESISNYGSAIPVLGKIPQAAKSVLRGWNAINGAWDVSKDNFAEGGYYPTQGPPKALFKGYAQGGYTNPYNQYQDDPYLQYKVGGKVWKNIAAGLYGAGEGILDTITGGATDQLTDRVFEGLTKAGNKNIDLNNPDDVKFLKSQQKVKGYTNTAGAIGTAVVTGNVQGAIKQGSKGLNTAFQATDGMSDEFKKWSQGISSVAGVASGFAGGLNSDSFNSAQQATQAAQKAGTGVKTFGQKASMVGSFGNQVSGMIGGNQQPLWQQGEARQDFLNSPEQLALKRQNNQDYINQGLMYSLGGNITNNSLNLHNTMRYKRFAQGGAFSQNGITILPKSGALHHESADGGIPFSDNALAEGGEIIMDTPNGNKFVVSDTVDGTHSQPDFTFSKGGKYKELNRTLADGMRQDLKKYTMGGLATNPKFKDEERRPYGDSYSEEAKNQIKELWQQKTEYAKQRNQQDKAIAQAEEQKRMAEEQYIAAYGGRINPKKYPGLNMTKRAKGGYVHNQMTQPMLAEGGPLYGDPASEYTYAMGGMYGDPYARGGQIDYTTDMYSLYAGGGPMPSNLPQAFDGPAAQNSNGMYAYPDGGMLPPEQQMMQEQQMQQEQMQQQPNQEQMMQAVQQAAQMLSQQMPPEQVMGELVKAGIPQEIAMQAVQMAMQEVASQMQQQGQEQMMPPQGMAHGGMYPDNGKKVYTNPAAFQKANTAYTDSLDTYNNLNLINKRIDAQIAKPANQRAFASHAQFKPWMQGLINTAVSKGDINSNLLQNAPVKQIQHVSGNPTGYTPVTATAPKVKPVFQPFVPPKSNLPIQQVTQPTPVQPTPRAAAPQTPAYQPHRVYQPPAKGQGSGRWLDLNDESQRRDALEQNKINQSGNSAIPSNVVSFKANGGMVSPQDGMSSQIAQQLKQGANPEQVLQDLVNKGMSQEQAMAMVQAIMSQVTSEMQQQQPQQQMAPPQQMMAARGGYFNGKKQYGNGDEWAPNQDSGESSETTFSPLADESTMSQIAGLGQAVVPALTSAFAFNKLSKRKIKPTTMEAALQNRDAEINALRDEWGSQTAAGLRQQRNMGQTAGSVAGNTRDLILSSLKEGQKPIMQIYSEMSAANQQAKQQANLANKQAADDFAKENESMYQNAMQTGFEAAGQGVKNAASYYSDLENRKLQRWQAMNTTGENWTWTPRGKAFRNKDGIYMINGIEVDPSTGDEI